MLYNKNDQGTDELIARLGFFSRDFNFGALAPYLDDAARELSELFSTEVYCAVEEHYHSDSFDPFASDIGLSGKDIVTRCFQRIAGAIAYIALAPNNDLSHDAQGRSINMTENQRAAYADQIERSNDALRAIVSEGIDTIYALLEQYGQDFPQWHASRQYASMQDTLLPTAGAFSDVFDIGASYYLFRKLSPSIRITESTRIRPLLGDDRYNKVKADTHNADPISRMARRALAAHVIADTIVRGSMDYYTRNIVPAKASLSERQAEREALLEEYRSLTDSIRMRISAESSPSASRCSMPDEGINDPDSKYYYNGLSDRL